VTRGGSYAHFPVEIGVTIRSFAAPTGRLPYLGFRCVFDPH
jgi:hypothetical protein